MSRRNTYFIAPTVVYTDRVQAFSATTGIVDETILGALNTFDLSIIAGTFENAIIALRVFVGGSASEQMVDFFANRNITFNGGWTYPNGALPNGTNGYYQANIIPANDMTESDYSYGFYFGNTSASNEFIGNYGSGSFFGMFKVGADLYIYSNTAVDISPITPSSHDGFHQVTKYDANNLKYKHTGEAIVTRASVPTTGMSPNEFTVGSALGLYDEREVLLDYFTNRALTSTEMADMETIVQTLQTALSRNV